MRLIVMVLLLGCGDVYSVPDAPPPGPDAMYCNIDAGTPYGGPIVLCAVGKGLCVAHGTGFGSGSGETCYPRCVGRLRDCPLNYYAMLIHVGGDSTECFCVPNGES